MFEDSGMVAAIIFKPAPLKVYYAGKQMISYARR
jgi:hypothetical protein